MLTGNVTIDRFVIENYEKEAIESNSRWGGILF